MNFMLSCRAAAPIPANVKLLLEIHVTYLSPTTLKMYNLTRWTSATGAYFPWASTVNRVDILLKYFACWQGQDFWFILDRSGGIRLRQKPQAPTPQARVCNRQNEKSRKRQSSYTLG